MNDHKLIIMRHAKSDWSTNVATDFKRPLTKRGVKAAENMGKWLKLHKNIPDMIISSPAVRAKMTAHIICDALGQSHSKVIWDKRIYGTTLDILLDIIRTHAKQAKTMLLIGHNPGLDALLTYLSIEEPELNQKGKLLTTAAIAILEFNNSIIKCEKHSANLIKLVRPKELDEI